MPDLPTLTVTTEQANRMLAAYGNIDAYREWLKNSIIDFVLMQESRAREQQFNADELSRRKQAEVDLGRTPRQE